MTRFRTLTAGLVALTVIVVVHHDNARAEISGWLPEPGEFGVASVVYSGGDLDGLIAEGASAGCRISAVWFQSDGQFLVYAPAAPPFVNAGFLDAFPGGVVSGPTALLITCAPESGSQGTPTPGDALPEQEPDPRPTPAGTPSATDIACGPQGNQATFELIQWRYPDHITDANSYAAVLVGYRFPQGAANAYFGLVLPTQFGVKSPEQIQAALGIETSSADGVVTISGAHGLAELNPVADGTVHYIELSGPIPNRTYFEAYAKGDLTYNRAPGLSFSQVATAFGVTDPYALGDPMLRFEFTMPDGKTWENTPFDQHSCDYVTG